MTPKKYTKKTAKQVHKTRRKKYFFRRWVILAILIVALIGTGFYLKQSISYYYALYFNKFKHKKLHNSEKEALRIQKIISSNLDKTYGLIFLIIRIEKISNGTVSASETKRFL
jgi:lysozyme